MKQIIALAIAISAGTAAIAVASGNETPVDAAMVETIKAQLAAEGYEVTEVEAEEDGMFEAYALKDGKTYEIELDSDLNIVETELEDD